MTVPTNLLDSLLTQYTGTGSRTFFEYGFETFDDTNVFVLVNGVAVSFVAQDTGVVIDPAPALNDTILIYRETDVTQLRDFQPFEAFKADKTESACDKLIMLKQEAELWRAFMNLYADPFVDRVEIVNDKGTDAIIYLWDQDESGMFAGQLGTLPNVGAVVTKPEDFAYFECAGGGAPPGFLNYEFVLLMTTQAYMTRLVGINYLTGDWTDFGSLYSGAEVSIASDGEFLFRHEGINDYYQYVWRGTCFSQVAFQNDTGSTIQGLNFITDMTDQFVVTGTVNGLRIKNYEREAPFSITTDADLAASSGLLVGVGDLRYGNNGEAELGDAFIAFPFNTSQELSTFRITAGTPVLVDQLTPNRNSGNQANHGWNRDTGRVLAISDTPNNVIDLYQVDMDTLNITFEGPGTTTEDVQAVTITNDDIIVTLERFVGPPLNAIIRTYSVSGTTLTPLDSLLLDAVDTGAASLRISPYSRRIWLLSTSSLNGGLAFEVASDGTITEIVRLPYGFGTSGYSGTFIGFLKDEITITTNGFTGIKQKLYECWEMNEAGSVTRAGSLGNADLPVVEGTVTNRTGVIGNAADFSGASALQVPCTDELNTVSTFSVCLDACIDTKAADQWVFMRGRSDFSTGVPEAEDIGLYYDSATDKFVFYVRVNTTMYSVSCDDLGTLTLGQFYHLYVEYNKSDNKVKIRGDGGTLYETSLPVHSDINHYSFARLTVGRRTSIGSTTRLDGGVDQMYWFWDALTTAQQDFMYNSGNSRAFSEL